MSAQGEHSRGATGSGQKSTFVLKEVGHSRPSRENKLRDIFDNLALLFRGESGEPFGQTLFHGLVYILYLSR
jgi:hypothetical protein